jgi:hypothetical protein
VYQYTKNYSMELRKQSQISGIKECAKKRPGGEFSIYSGPEVEPFIEINSEQRERETQTDDGKV